MEVVDIQALVTLCSVSFLSLLDCTFFSVTDFHFIKSQGCFSASYPTIRFLLVQKYWISLFEMFSFLGFFSSDSFSTLNFFTFILGLSQRYPLTKCWCSSSLSFTVFFSTFSLCMFPCICSIVTFNKNVFRLTLPFLVYPLAHQTYTFRCPNLSLSKPGLITFLSKLISLHEFLIPLNDDTVFLVIQRKPGLLP